MKRFTSEGTNDQEGRERIPAPRNGVEAPLGLSFEGGVAGVRTLSRRQALGLLGGSLVGLSLLSAGLAAPAKAAGSVPMVEIVGPRGRARPLLSPARGGNWWNLTLEWTCLFAPAAVNLTYRTGWRLMEQDTLSDDVVTATVEPHVHSASSPWKTFIPSQINPSNPRVVSFRHTRVWHQDDLDTELGGEELYAKVSIEDPSGGPVMNGRWWVPSDVLPLSP